MGEDTFLLQEVDRRSETRNWKFLGVLEKSGDFPLKTIPLQHESCQAIQDR